MTGHKTKDSNKYFLISFFIIIILTGLMLQLNVLRNIVEVALIKALLPSNIWYNHEHLLVQKYCISVYALSSVSEGHCSMQE